MLTAATTERAEAVVVVYAGAASTALDNKQRLRFWSETMNLLTAKPRPGEGGGGNFASAPPGIRVSPSLNRQKREMSTFFHRFVLFFAELFGGFTFSLLSPFYTKEAVAKGISVSQAGLVSNHALSEVVAVLNKMFSGVRKRIPDNPDLHPDLRQGAGAPGQPRRVPGGDIPCRTGQRRLRATGVG